MPFHLGSLRVILAAFSVARSTGIGHGRHSWFGARLRRQSRARSSFRAPGAGVLALVFAVTWGAPCRLNAADPQPYAVTLAATGNGALDAVLNDTSSLVSLQDKAPVGGFALVQRAREDVGRFQTALQSYGYYAARVSVSIDNQNLDDPALPDLIDHLPASPPAPVKVEFDLGAQFRLGAVSVEGNVPDGAQDALGLSPGQPAVAADVVAAQQQLLAAIRGAGYPLARVDLVPATLNPANRTLDVAFKIEAGQPANFGTVSVDGLKDMQESFVRRRLLLHEGERFSPAAIEKARQDLLSLGVFSAVRIEPATALDAHGQLPITIHLTERPLHAVDLGVAYSTDLGVNFNAGWHDRNLFGNAEQLNLAAQAQLGGNALNRPGYQLGAQFIKPDFLARDQSLEFDLNAIKQDLQAYNQNALTEKAVINRKLSAYWAVSGGIAAEQEEITQEGVIRNYDLIGMPLSVKYDSTSSLLDPTSGMRAALLLTPTAALGSRNSGFVIAELSGSIYFDFNSQGRSVLALRGLIGDISGTDVFGLPPDQRFYAGGSATVRGYRYQSVSPLFPDDKPIGGTRIAAGTVEFRQRIIGNYGAVAFIDAGEVAASSINQSSGVRVGAGVGFRYYTGFGPIRLDVAVPLDRQHGGDAFELYIGIGQAF